MTAPNHENKPAPIGVILLDHLRHNSGTALPLFRKNLKATANFQAAAEALLATIENETGGPVVLTALSNAVPDLNPFSGLSSTAVENPDSNMLENLVGLLGSGRIHEWNKWPAHFTLFSAQAVSALAAPDTDEHNALTRLRDAGGRLILSDTVFLHDPESDLHYCPPLEAHEQRHPPAWGDLIERLDDWLRHPGKILSGPQLEAFSASDKAATLHITHSWGGGIEQWIGSFIEADKDGVNLQLRSESPQSGRGCGQRYSLYLADHLQSPIAIWWVQPPIQSTEIEHSSYRRMLGEISSRYGIGRVVVSSLIGHSLEALTTGLPTIQVLHDFYPRWPLLGVHPAPYLQSGEVAALEKAITENRLLSDLSDRDAAGWEALGQRWRETVSSHGVQVVAPSRSVADLLRQLDPNWSQLDIEIIPHGLPELKGKTEVLPRHREDGRLRLVIPGSIQQGKGQGLLLQALPELTKYAQVYLLGCGKSGEAFFGKSGVDVIIRYDRDELKSLLATIGPHFAALLSIVPETFSYTLSEMQQLNIPVVATRVGSLEERISDGETGWLIDPDAEALLARVRSLAAKPELLTEMHARLTEFDLPGARRMVSHYDRICRPRPAARLVTRESSNRYSQASAEAFHKLEFATRARELGEQAVALQEEVEKRTAWAEQRERARIDEKDRRIQWVSRLEGHIEKLDVELKETGNRLHETAENLNETTEKLRVTHETLEHEQGMRRQTGRELEELRTTHDWVLGSKSWRITRPFRFAGRVLSNLGRAQAWNPLKWPLLLSQLSRTIKTRGLRGAMMRSQLSQQASRGERVDTSVVEAIGDSSAPESFPQIANPQVSLVIPVYNKWEYTAACLRSLLDTHCETSFEVIVVDDQSTDESPGYLESIEGLVNIRNEQNLGFVGSCNRGAEEARGKYIVMLNNDTQVLDGWLDALIETFQQHPNTGLAGARLIYPDGSLQEAGGMVFNDGSGWNYGRNDNPDRPEYQYCREVAYCSGACLMLRTDLFRELGGFDSRYAPAYYEDTDLAFRIREQGMEVRLQPASTIIHHEGVTSGTDLGSGTKRYQAVNRDKFLERWQQQLEHYPAPIVDPTDEREIRQARDHHLKGRVLIIDAYTPEPDQDSGSLRLRYLMQCFAQLGYGVTFLPDNRAYAGNYSKDLQQAGIEVIFDPWVGSLQRFFSNRCEEFSFVMISRHYIASKYVGLLKRHCPKARFIFDTVDLHYLREERMAKLENSLPLQRSAAQTRRSELAVIEAADATLVVSPVEKTVLQEAAPDATVHIISNVHEVVGCRQDFNARKDIFFVGGYQHPPNIDAATWFVRKIWPLIHAELPDLVFHLIGSKAPEEVRALHGNGVQFHGFVESLEPWLDNCRLAVAPLRYGAGIKGKVNISMSRGQPVVATPMAVEGMFAKPGHDIMVAESAEDFAAAVVKIYQDEELWNRVSVSGLENVRQYFSVETARLGLQQLIKSLQQSE